MVFYVVKYFLLPLTDAELFETSLCDCHGIAGGLNEVLVLALVAG